MMKREMREKVNEQVYKNGQKEHDTSYKKQIIPADILERSEDDDDRYVLRHTRLVT